jgi:hypothetical protein
MNLLAPASQQYVSPFYRFERYDTQAEVPGGYQRAAASNRIVHTVGVSYKPIPRVVLKADYQGRRDLSGGRTDEYNLAVGYEF